MGGGGEGTRDGDLAGKGAQGRDSWGEEVMVRATPEHRGVSVPRLGGPRVPLMRTRLGNVHVYKGPPEQRGSQREGCSKVKFSAWVAYQTAGFENGSAVYFTF